MVMDLHCSSGRYRDCLSPFKGVNANLFPINVSFDLDLSPVVGLTTPRIVVEGDGSSFFSKEEHSWSGLVVLAGFKFFEVPVPILIQINSIDFQ